MTLPKRITAKWLLEKGASCGQVQSFQRHWPDGAEITLDNLKKAQRMELDLSWLIRYCLPPSWVKAWRKQEEELLSREGVSVRREAMLFRRLDRETILRAAGKQQP